MASELQSAGQPIKVWIKPSEELPAVQHELIIRTRQQNVNPIAADVLGELTLKTIGLWLTVFKAIETKTYEIDRQAPEKELSIERTSLEPLVTVFNKTWDGLSVTVNSGDDGKGAVSAVLALDYALDTMRQKLPQLFQVPVSTQAKVNHAAASASQAPDIDEFLQDDPYQQSKQATVSDEGEFKHRAWVRSTKVMTGVPNVIKLEGGKTDAPNWNTTALLANQAYDHKAIQYDDKSLIAYEITGALQYNAYEDDTFMYIPTNRGNIRVYCDNGEHGYEWRDLVKKLNLDEESLAVGQKAIIPATYVVMKCRNSGEKQYKSFYGFYSKPE